LELIWIEIFYEWKNFNKMELKFVEFSRFSLAIFIAIIVLKRKLKR
jgi:hypothetical protein